MNSRHNGGLLSLRNLENAVKDTRSSTFRQREQRLHGVTQISLITSCGFASLRWASVTTKCGQRSQRLPGLLRPLGKERRRGSHSDWLDHLLWFFITTMDSCHYEAWTTRQREQRLHGVTVISLITSCGFPSLRWISVTTKLGERSQGYQVFYVSAKRAEAARGHCD